MVSSCKKGNFLVRRNRMDVKFAVVLAVLVFAIAMVSDRQSWCAVHVIGANAYELCGGDDSDGDQKICCPTGNTCCRVTTSDSNDNFSWGCIASDMGAGNATCCSDDDERNTGCPAGYECRRTEHKEHQVGGSSVVSYDCFLPKEENVANFENGSSNHYDYDPLMQVLPRYRLCRAEENNKQLYGLPVVPRSPTPQVKAEISYYSNLGPIDDTANNQLSKIDMALVIVHGAIRNGDDYFCSAKATIDLQDRFGKTKTAAGGANKTTVLVVAPTFLSTPTLTNGDAVGVKKEERVLHATVNHSSSFLYWNEANDRDGSWRYGADASGPIPGISSYDVMDAIVLNLRSTRLFPNLRRIAVAGHSSGGQFVQRWSILTPSEVWSPFSSSTSFSTQKTAIGPEEPVPFISKSNDENDSVALHAVVANPSNYVYFTPLRFLNNDSGSSKNNKHHLRNGNNETMHYYSYWKVPLKVNSENGSKYKDCPFYNQWEYGLDDGGNTDVPYRQRAIARESKSKIIERYLKDRSVSYLIGDLDRCDDGDDNDGNNNNSKNSTRNRCQSHGLETTCADELQGRNRYERNARYLASLRLYYCQQQTLQQHNTTKMKTKTRTTGALTLTESAEDSAACGRIFANKNTNTIGNHRRVIVPNVGHDHSMMFQSKEGIDAIYYRTVR